MTSLDAIAPSIARADRNITVGIAGITHMPCAACSARSERVLKRAPGVAAANALSLNRWRVRHPGDAQ